ncbi:MAG: hypothetical protein CMG41_03395 [Candidatus Marinimicrobia bacterium]|nr:hypothetical protein [Candidatus Neomarinimicrobiota bacterium]|tara:strand:- start:3194 stop:4102 length:909 start_codon:yes stop_codon:yes gene_type:complete
MNEFSHPSQHGNLRGVIWDDVQNPIGTVQIAHGLAEYHGRYIETAQFLNSLGYIVYCNDHLGHGLHISDGKLKGYFKEEGGYDAVVDQLAEMNSHIRKENPSLNHYILSHSLGTPLTLSLLQRNVSFHGVVLSAPFSITSGLLFLNNLLLWPEYTFNDRKSISNEMEKHTTLKHNSFFEPNRTTHDFLSRDEVKVDEYIADPYCGFPKTIQLWKDLVVGFKDLWTKKSFSSMDTKIPFLVLTGSEDPINDKGKQAQEISNLLIDCGFKAEFKSYEGMRHEPFTEIQRDTVMHKIKEFFGSNI